MVEILEEQQPEFYEIRPEFNSAGRLCNHGSGTNPTAKVPADEWERFNQLAGRQHEIVDGIVVYNAELEPCMPDNVAEPTQLDIMQSTLDALVLATLEG